MNIPTIFQDLIRLNSSEQSYNRGERYYYNGMVLSATLRGQHLQAFVQGVG